MLYFHQTFRIFVIWANIKGINNFFPKRNPARTRCLFMGVKLRAQQSVECEKEEGKTTERERERACNREGTSELSSRPGQKGFGSCVFFFFLFLFLLLQLILLNLPLATVNMSKSNLV